MTASSAILFQRGPPPCTAAAIMTPAWEAASVRPGNPVSRADVPHRVVWWRILVEKPVVVVDRYTYEHRLSSTPYATRLLVLWSPFDPYWLSHDADAALNTFSPSTLLALLVEAFMGVWIQRVNFSIGYLDTN
jgi:hypothetical protein